MKKLILQFSLILIPFLLNAQQTPADKLFDKYSGKEGFTYVYISKYMFDLFSNIESNDKDYQGFKNVVGKLDNIKILVADDEYRHPDINFFREIMKELPTSEYKELMVVKEKDQDFKFLIKEEKGKIYELLMIGGGKDNLLISIQGDIDLKTISKLSKSLEIKGLEELEKIDKKEKK